MVFCNGVETPLGIVHKKGHNPYFNRWFSAIYIKKNPYKNYKEVTILILIDGFLQYKLNMISHYRVRVTILILIDGFLQ